VAPKSGGTKPAESFDAALLRIIRRGEPDDKKSALAEYSCQAPFAASAVRLRAMTDEPSFDASSRRLCPDGSCTGIITPQGVCSECGMAAGDANEGARYAPATSDESSDAPLATEAKQASENSQDGGGFDPNRKLCPDGSCVGVIGTNGRSDSCGRSAPEGAV